MDFAQMMTLLIVSQRHLCMDLLMYTGWFGFVLGSFWHLAAYFILLTSVSLWLTSLTDARVLKQSENCDAPAHARCSGYLTFCFCFFCTVFLINIILYHLLVYTILYPVLTILTSARCMLINSGLPVQFWAEAVRTSNILHNLSPTKANANAAPVFSWDNKLPNVRIAKTG